MDIGIEMKPTEQITFELLLKIISINLKIKVCYIFKKL